MCMKAGIYVIKVCLVALYLTKMCTPGLESKLLLVLGYSCSCVKNNHLYRESKGRLCLYEQCLNFLLVKIFRFYCLFVFFFCFFFF